MLATVVSDPFAQQLISFNQCTVLDSSANATAPRTGYCHWDLPIDPNVAQSLPLDLQLSIYKGVFGDPGDMKVQPDCPTGNCTFPPYHTLGFCSFCEDVSHELKHVTITADERVIVGELDVEIEHILPSTSGGDVSTSTITSTILSTTTSTFTGSYNGPTAFPNGTQVYTSREHYTLNGNPTAVEFNNSGLGCPPDCPTFMQISSADKQEIGQEFNLVAGFLQGAGPGDRTAFLQNPHPDCDSNDANRASWPCRGQGAARCSLRSCVQTISTNMANGNLTETLVASVDLRNSSNTLADRDCLVRKNNASAIAAGQSLNDSRGNNGWLAYYKSPGTRSANIVNPYNVAVNVSGDNGVIGPSITLDPECVYTVSNDNVQGLSTFLFNFLNLSLPLSTAGYEYIPSLTQGGATPLLNRIFLGGNLTLGSVDSNFHGIANSISAYFRRNGDSGGGEEGDEDGGSGSAVGFSEAAQGLIYTAETCITVNWSWLAYPCALAILVLAFFLGIMVESIRYRQQDWKTSILPVLFHGLREPPTDTGEESHKHKAMEQMARKVKVQLADTSEGWKLIDIAPSAACREKL